MKLKFRNIQLGLGLWMLSMGLMSCRKDDSKPEAPQITFVSISTQDVVAFDNQVVVRFSYEDYQGDLGEPDPDIYSLRVKDNRLSAYDEYHIPPMTPDLLPLHIRGEFEVALHPLFILGNGTQEQTHFNLQIRDRNGNWSNTITTPAVYIHN